MRCAVIVTLLFNLVAIQFEAASSYAALPTQAPAVTNSNSAIPLDLAALATKAKTQPRTGQVCNFEPSHYTNIAGQSNPGLFGLVFDASNQPFTNPFVVTATQVINNQPTGPSFSAPSSAGSFNGYNNSFYINITNTVGYNIQAGDDFIVQIHATSGTQPDFFYPQRLSAASAMHVHFSTGLAASGADSFPACDMIDDYNTAGSDIGQNGGIHMNLLSGPVMGGRIVQRAAFSADPNTLTDSDIFAASGVAAASTAVVSVCPWNYSDTLAVQNPQLPNPTDASCIHPSNAIDQDGYYAVGNGNLVAGTKYVVLFSGSGYRPQAYYYNNIAVPTNASETTAVGFLMESHNGTALQSMPSAAPHGQTLFNGVLDGADAIVGTVTDGRTNCDTVPTSGSPGPPLNPGPVPFTDVLAFDTSSSSPDAVSQGQSDASGVYTLTTLSPGRSYTIKFVPPQYNGVMCTPSVQSSASIEYALYQTTTGTLDTSTITTTINAPLPLGQGLSGTVYSAVGQTFNNVTVQVQVFDNSTPNDPHPIASNQVVGNGSSFSYTFPRVLPSTGQFQAEYAPIGNSNPSFQARWFSGALNTGQGGNTGVATRGAAAALNAGTTGVNITLPIGSPLTGVISPPSGVNLSSSAVVVQVNIYEADSKGLVTTFEVQPTGQASYNWTSSALDTNHTAGYLVQFIPAAGVTTGFDPVYYSSSSSLGTTSQSGAGAVKFVNSSTTNPASVNVTLTLGGEIRVVLKNANGQPYSGVAIAVENKVGGICQPSQIVVQGTSSGYDGTADFLDLPASASGVPYCVALTPQGNVPSYIYGTIPSELISLQPNTPVTIVYKFSVLPQATITGYLYAVDGNETSQDFKAWSVSIYAANNASGNPIAQAPVSTQAQSIMVGGITYPHAYKYTSVVALNGQAFIVGFNPPINASDTHYVQEYYGTISNQHSPTTNLQAQTLNPISGAVVTDVDGQFVCGATLSMVVQDNSTSQPVQGASVGFYTSTNTSISPILSFGTGPNGIASSPLIPAGTYYVFVSSPTGNPAPYTGQWYNGVGPSNGTGSASGAVAVTIGCGTSSLTSGTTIKLPPTIIPTTTTTTTTTPTPITPTPPGNGGIAGTIFGSVNGNPAVALANTTIQIVDLSDTLVAAGSTDGSGNYNISVPPGSYKVYVTNSSFGAPNEFYSSSNANGVPDFNSASSVGVVGGNVTGSINVTLALNSGPTTPVPPSVYTYYLPFLANNGSGVGGTYTTYLSVQNVGISPAQVSISYYSTSGGLLGIDSNGGNTLAVSASYVSQSSLPSGSVGSAYVVSTQPMAVIVTEAGTFGGSGVLSAYNAINGNNDAATTLYAPNLLNQAFGGSFNTSLVLQNTANSDAVANIQYYNGNGTLAGTAQVTVPKKSTQTIAQANLPSGFNGWGLVTSNQKLAGVVIQTNLVNKFLSTVSCAGKPGAKLYLPVVFKNAFGNFGTGVSLVNPNTTAANVTVSYTDGGGHKIATSQDSFTIPANGTQLLYHPNLAELPSGFAGSALISSNVPLVSLTNEQGTVTNPATGVTVPNSGTFGTILSTSNKVSFPVAYRKAYGSFSSGLQVLNISNVATTLTITYYNPDGTVKTSHQFPSAVQPNGIGNLYVGGDNSLSDGFTGTAIVSADNANAQLLLVDNVSDGNFFYTFAEPAYN
jgi:hypothetical protein